MSGLHDKARKVAKDFDDFLEGVVEEHVSNKDKSYEEQDLVDILLDVQRENETGFSLQRDTIKAVILVNFLLISITTHTLTHT